MSERIWPGAPDRLVLTVQLTQLPGGRSVDADDVTVVVEDGEPGHLYVSLRSAVEAWYRQNVRHE